MTAYQRVVIDATNLDAGGGVQVATSFLGDLLHATTRKTLLAEFPWLTEAGIFASSTVRANLETMLEKSDLAHVRALPRRGLPGSHTRFTVFGPVYGRSRTLHSVMGFADVTSIYDWPKGLPRRPLRQHVRKPLAMHSFRRAEELIVETEAVKQRLQRLGFDETRITVVPNSCNPIFLQAPKWRNTYPGNANKPMRLLYVARGYPHKNHDFLGLLARELALVHDINIRYTVTLSDSEWMRKSDTFRQYAENVGVTRLQDLPKLYLATDAVIFPSLLECFSATPLEAMAMGVPLLASNRDFVRTSAHGAAWYFDPERPEAAADQLAHVLRDPSKLASRIQVGADHMRAAPTSLDRTRAYLRKIDSMTKA